MKRKLTRADLKKTLSELGFKEGQELELPSPSKPNVNEQSESNEGDEGEDDGGIEVPKKPPPPQP